MSSLNPSALTRAALVFLASCLVSFPLSTYAQSDDSAAAELNWKNGDKLPGLALQCDRSTLRWQANIFRDPLDIDLAFLDRIDFLSTASVEKTNQTYSIQTIDGFSLYGEIKELNDSHLILESDRFGEVRVLRNKIASILNLKTSGTLINSDFDLDRWDANRNEKKYWMVNDQGQLQSLRNDVHLFLKSDLPQSAMIEVELEWEKSLDFIFGFGIPNNSRKIDSLPRLESWDGSIVLSYGEDEFEIVMGELPASEKRLKFLVHWNRETNQLMVHDERGQQLAVADLGKSVRRLDSGIYIENKSGDLKVNSLMIRRSSAGFDATTSSIQSIDGSAVNGVLKSFDGNTWLVSPAGEGDEKLVKVAKDSFCGAFRINPVIDRPLDGARIKYQDGMYVRGDFVSLQDETLTFKTDFLVEPIKLKLSDAKSLRFDSISNDTKVDFTHRLINKIGEIQGRLEQGSGADGDVLRWRVAGAKAAVPFSSGDARIILQEKAQFEDIEEKWADTLYLANRDTVPCRVIGMDEGSVTVESFFENKIIDQALVKAVDFRNQVYDEEVSGKSEEWLIANEAGKRVKRYDNMMALKKNAELAHPWLFATGGFECELTWRTGEYGALECRTLLSDLDSSEGGKKINIMVYGESIYVGNPGDTPNNEMIRVRRGKVKLAFRYHDGCLKVSINGKEVYSEPARDSTNRGRGVQFKLLDPFQQKFECELRNFTLLSSSKGNSLLVDDDQKNLLLTIPRLKKNNPPKQVLCATNLDMVRGEMVSLDDQYVMFRANDDVKRFPRQIVSSVVWLHADDLAKEDQDAGADKAPEVESADSAGDTGSDGIEKATEGDRSTTLQVENARSSTQTVQVLMHGNRRMTAALNSWTDEGLVGESEALGGCKIPFDQIYELRFGSFASEATDVPYSDWVAKLAPSPKLETGTGSESGSEFIFGSSSLLIGTTPKTFSLPMLEDGSFVLNQQKGKIVVLDFWATWCGPCVKALPDISSTVAEYPSDKVVLMAVNLEETQEQVKAFLEARELDVPVCLDADGKVGRQFQVKSIPQTVIIDQQGRVAFVKVGGSNDMKEKLKAALDHLLMQELGSEK